MGGGLAASVFAARHRASSGGSPHHPHASQYLLLSPSEKAAALLRVQRCALLTLGAAERVRGGLLAARSLKQLHSVLAVGTLLLEHCTAVGFIPRESTDSTMATHVVAGAGAPTLRAASLALGRLPLLKDAAEAVTTPLHSRSQLHRAWWRWTLFVGVCVGGGVALYQHRDALASAVAESKVALVRFYAEHVAEPAAAIAGELLGPGALGGLGVAPLHVAEPRALADAQANLSRMLADLYGRLDPSDLSPELRGQDLAALAAAGDMRPAFEAFAAEAPHAFRGAVMGHLTQSVLVQVEFLKKEVLAAMAALDTVMAQNRFNLQLMAAIPALLVVYACGLALRGGAGALLDAVSSSSSSSGGGGWLAGRGGGGLDGLRVGLRTAVRDARAVLVVGEQRQQPLRLSMGNAEGGTSAPVIASADDALTRYATPPPSFLSFTSLAEEPSAPPSQSLLFAPQLNQLNSLRAAVEGQTGMPTDHPPTAPATAAATSSSPPLPLTSHLTSLWQSSGVPAWATRGVHAVREYVSDTQAVLFSSPSPAARLAPSSSTATVGFAAGSHAPAEVSLSASTRPAGPALVMASPVAPSFYGGEEEDDELRSARSTGSSGPPPVIHYRPPHAASTQPPFTFPPAGDSFREGGAPSSSPSPPPVYASSTPPPPPPPPRDRGTSAGSAPSDEWSGGVSGSTTERGARGGVASSRRLPVLALQYAPPQSAAAAPASVVPTSARGGRGGAPLAPSSLAGSVTSVASARSPPPLPFFPGASATASFSVLHGIDAAGPAAPLATGGHSPPPPPPGTVPWSPPSTSVDLSSTLGRSTQPARLRRGAGQGQPLPQPPDRSVQRGSSGNPTVGGGGVESASSAPSSPPGPPPPPSSICSESLASGWPSASASAPSSTVHYSNDYSHPQHPQLNVDGTPHLWASSDRAQQCRVLLSLLEDVGAAPSEGSAAASRPPRDAAPCLASSFPGMRLHDIGVLCLSAQRLVRLLAAALRTGGTYSYHPVSSGGGSDISDLTFPEVTRLSLDLQALVAPQHGVATRQRLLDLLQGSYALLSPDALLLTPTSVGGARGKDVGGRALHARVLELLVVAV